MEYVGDPLRFELRSAGLRVRCPTVRRENHMELPVGFEPTIHCLQGSRVSFAPQEHIYEEIRLVIGDSRETRTHINGLTVRRPTY